MQRKVGEMDRVADLLTQLLFWLDLLCRPFIDSHRWRQVAHTDYEMDAKICAEFEFDEMEKKFQRCSKSWIFFLVKDSTWAHYSEQRRWNEGTQNLYADDVKFHAESEFEEIKKKYLFYSE